MLGQTLTLAAVIVGGLVLFNIIFLLTLAASVEICDHHRRMSIERQVKKFSEQIEEHEHEYQQVR